jgi:hypothetical protein
MARTLTFPASANILPVEPETVCPEANSSSPAMSQQHQQQPGYETIRDDDNDDVVVQDSSSSDTADRTRSPGPAATASPVHVLDPFGFIRNMDSHGNIMGVDGDDDDSARPVVLTLAETNRNQRRTQKWNLMLSSHLDRVRRRRPVLVTRRLRKGVPHTLRSAVWCALANVEGKKKMNTGLYDKLVRDAAFGVTQNGAGETVSHDKGFQKIQDTIERDIHRTFPRHALFYDANEKDEVAAQPLPHDDGFCSSTAEISDILHDLEFGSATAGRAAINPDARPPDFVIEAEGGQASLRRVLKAYSVYDREVGYCQGMNFISAMFLTIMPEEDAFWMLVGRSATVFVFCNRTFLRTMMCLTLFFSLFCSQPQCMTSHVRCGACLPRECGKHTRCCLWRKS